MYTVHKLYPYTIKTIHDAKRCMVSTFLGLYF